MLLEASLLSAGGFASTLQGCGHRTPSCKIPVYICLQDLLSPFRLRAFRNFDALFVFMMDIFMRVFFLGKIRRIFQESRILRLAYCDLLFFDDPWRFALL